MTASLAAVPRRGGRRPLSLRRLATYGLVLVIASYALLPAYWTIMTAVRPVDELMDRFPSWIPGGVQLDRFVNVWSEVTLAGYMFNSAIVVLITVLVAVTSAGLAGYALSRIEFPGNGLIVALILFTQAIPTVVALVPFYFILNGLGLINTRGALPLSYIVWAVPFATLLLRGYFKTAFSKDIEDAARVDGASRFGTLWRIALPLSLPGLLSAAILIGVGAWNEFLWASLVAPREDIRTVSVGLNTFVGRFGANEQVATWMAGAIFVALPPLILYVVAYRRVSLGYGVAER